MNEKEKKYDPMKEVAEATLCLHCIHNPICIIKKETIEFQHKWWNTVPNLPRLLSQIAESCKYYNKGE